MGPETFITPPEAHGGEDILGNRPTMASQQRHGHRGRLSVRGSEHTRGDGVPQAPNDGTQATDGLSFWRRDPVRRAECKSDATDSGKIRLSSEIKGARR